MNEKVIHQNSEARILTVNGGSSSIKFAVFEASQELRRILSGQISGIGSSKGHFSVKGRIEADNFSRGVDVADHTAAVRLLVEWVEIHNGSERLIAIGHRVVHGGSKYWQPQHITGEMVNELRRLSQFDPEHLPEEILLVEAFQHRFPDLSQVACFDTGFHHDMPRVARLLPIPRRYDSAGVRRYGFHGLSCSYLIEELSRLAVSPAEQGRVILAHLGNGASLTAVLRGQSIDTSMSFTPTAGLPMSTRSGDLDPGLIFYLANTEQMTAKQFQHMVNHESGLLGISETSSDVRDLLDRETTDVRAAESIELFCYQTRKWICALAGALEGLDTLVFAGGIGENASEIRKRISRGMEWMGIQLDDQKNRDHAPVISAERAAVKVRVIHTDEESIIAKTTYQVTKSANQETK
jgi:acetate kinase